MTLPEEMQFRTNEFMVKHKENDPHFYSFYLNENWKKQKCGHFLMNLLSWSISRVLSWTIIPLGDKLLCRSSNLPELWTGHPLSSYLVLLRVEFTLLHVVTNGTVCSYHTLSPLPFSRRSALCCTGRRLTPPGRYPALCPL